jgi:hypothetical protein
VSAALFLALSLGATAISLLALGVEIRRSDESVKTPADGDVPCVPEELLEQAYTDARLRNAASAYEAKS